MPVLKFVEGGNPEITIFPPDGKGWDAVYDIQVSATHKGGNMEYNLLLHIPLRAMWKSKDVLKNTGDDWFEISAPQPYQGYKLVFILYINEKSLTIRSLPFDLKDERKDIIASKRTDYKICKVHAVECSLNETGMNATVSSFDTDNHAKPLKTPPAIANASQAFVKFFGVGTAKGRIDLSDRVIDIVRIQECHRVLAYPTGFHPRQVQDGDVVFISRMTKNPNDHRIFGWAIATKHRDGLDEATDEDITRCPWRKEYGSYIRVDEEGFEAEFLDGTMGAGVSLYDLMKVLGSDSFASTQRNASAGKGNTDPRKSIARKPHIQLSEKGFAWLTDKLQEAFAKHGKITLNDIEESD